MTPLRVESFEGSCRPSPRCLTPELVEFNARIWGDEKDLGLGINEPLKGVVTPESLKPFEVDFVRMDNIKWRRGSLAAILSVTHANRLLTSNLMHSVLFPLSGE